MNKKIKIEPFIERLNNLDFEQGTKFKFLDKVYLYDYPNLVGVYEIGKPTKPEYSIFAQLDMTNLHCEVEILEDNTEEIETIKTLYGITEPEIGWENEGRLLKYLTELREKVNELTEAVNKMKEGKE